MGTLSTCRFLHVIRETDLKYFLSPNPIGNIKQQNAVPPSATFLHGTVAHQRVPLNFCQLP